MCKSLKQFRLDVMQSNAIQSIAQIQTSQHEMCAALTLALPTPTQLHPSWNLRLKTSRPKHRLYVLPHMRFPSSTDNRLKITAFPWAQITGFVYSGMWRLRAASAQAVPFVFTCVLCRVGQNHIYTVWYGIFGRESTIYTVIYGV